MKLDQESADNLGILAYLARGELRRVPIASPSSVPDPYYGCGSHPDIVERLWDELGRGLPRQTRALVFGTPALVQAAGIVLAVALGTSYALRLPSEACLEPPGSGLESRHTFRTAGVTLDLASFGPTWRFGGWHVAEVGWVASVHAALEPA